MGTTAAPPAILTTPTSGPGEAIATVATAAGTPAGGEGMAAPAAQFTALIDALLQGGGGPREIAPLPPGAPAAVPATEATVADLPVGAACAAPAEASTQPEVAEAAQATTTDAWLMTLALSQWAGAPLAQPQPRSVLTPPAGAGTPAAAGETAAEVASGAAAGPGPQPATGGDGAPATPAAATLVAGAAPAFQELVSGPAPTAAGPEGLPAGDEPTPAAPARVRETAPALGASPPPAGERADSEGGPDALATLAEAGRLLAAASEAGAAGSTAPAGSNTASATNPWIQGAHRPTTPTTQPTPQAASTTAEASLREPVGTLKWKDELGAQLTLMAARGQQSGSLRLNPEHLGPVEVQITVRDEQASVQFGAQQADTRAALQESLPRLRELFNAAGLTLGHSGVSQQAPRQHAEAAHAPTGDSGADSDGEPSRAPAPVRQVTHLGLLDTYA